MAIKQCVRSRALGYLKMKDLWGHPGQVGSNSANFVFPPSSQVHSKVIDYVLSMWAPRAQHICWPLASLWILVLKLLLVGDKIAGGIRWWVVRVLELLVFVVQLVVASMVELLALLVVELPVVLVMVFRFTVPEAPWMSIDYFLNEGLYPFAVCDSRYHSEAINS